METSINTNIPVIRSAQKNSWRYLSGTSTAAFLRRWCYWTLVLLTTLGGALMMADILQANRLTLAEILILVFFVTAFALIAASFWNAVIGFLVHLLARDPLAVAAPVTRNKALHIDTRTAILMPVYNEDPQRVAAGLEAVYRSLEKTGELRRFVFFLLSDTTQRDIAAGEVKHWRILCQRLNAHGRLRYRRRLQNTRRKVGNIADFCQRWGKKFDHMLILDADSVMSGATIVDMVKIMQANPRTALLQALPTAVNQDTPFARILQFGSRLCSEMLTTGASFWQLGRANYFGHNALIRIEPFMQHCEMPVIPGHGPLSGEVLSHDFIEAAFLQRAGWEVWNLPYSSGSYEEIPSNIVDYAKRDRRWCQGNLQHLKLLCTRGLTMMSRLHLFLGIMSYLGSLLWFMLIVLGIYLLWDHALSQHDYFEADQLFPIWEIVKTGESISLFSITIALLVIPKLLAAIVVLCQHPLRRAYGGGFRLFISLFLEIVFTMLIAPVMMVFHLLFVSSIFFGRLIGWNAQPRGNRGLTLAEALSCQQWQTACGVVIIAAVTLVAPQHLWWMLPIVSGLLLAAPLAVFSSQADIGCRLRRLGLFVTPEESTPPIELRALRQHDGDADQSVSTGSDASAAHSPIEPSYSVILS